MKAKCLYPNIAYFEALKEMPLCPVGSTVSIRDIDGRECLYVNGIEMPLEAAKIAADWFCPVTLEEHAQTTKDNFYKYCKELGKSEEQIKAAWELL